jgi:hypothetical protein
MANTNTKGPDTPLEQALSAIGKQFRERLIAAYFGTEEELRGISI